VGLYLAGAEVFLRGRDGGRTRVAADEIEVGALEPGALPDQPAILVNATPLGMRAGDASPFDAGEVKGALAVVDMVYGPEETALVAFARAAGLPAADGLTVLAQQGFAQHAAFTGTLPPKAAMLEVLGK
jgi:shikimate dehydrogenase